MLTGQSSSVSVSDSTVTDPSLGVLGNVDRHKEWRTTAGWSHFLSACVLFEGASIPPHELQRHWVRLFMKTEDWAKSGASPPPAEDRLVEEEAPPDKPDAPVGGNGSWSQWHQFLDKELFDIFAQCQNWRHAKCPVVKDGEEAIASRKRKFDEQETGRLTKQPVVPVKRVNWGDCNGFPGGKRVLPGTIAGPPFFFFEHLPSQDWVTVSRLFFDLEPEPMDARHHSACRRPRGYIHNLPVQGRTPALLPPAMSIKELFPDPCWPPWDVRQKHSSPHPRPNLEEVGRVAKDAEAAASGAEARRRRVTDDMRRLGMVWAGGKARQLSVTELEVLLGYKPGHTDGSGTKPGCHTEAQRFKWLHTAPSVHVLAFQFSVLKPLFLGGIAVLSLCSGIAGPAVALHRLGVPVRLLVSFDTDPLARTVLAAWWEQAFPRGTLVQDAHDVRGLTRTNLANLVARYGKFDLVVCGTQCKNLPVQPRSLGLVPPLLYEMNRVIRDVRDLGR